MTTMQTPSVMKNQIFLARLTMMRMAISPENGAGSSELATDDWRLTTALLVPNRFGRDFGKHDLRFFRCESRGFDVPGEPEQAQSGNAVPVEVDLVPSQ